MGWGSKETYTKYKDGDSVATDGREFRSKEKSTNDVCYSAFEFSFKNFFSSGIKSLFRSGCPSKEKYYEIISQMNITEKIKEMSKIFKDIVTVPVCETAFCDKIELANDLTVLASGEYIGKFINDIINKHYAENPNESEYLLYVKGPIGCYKNRLLQYICLDQSFKLGVPIFYIDFAKYERKKLRNVTEDINNIKNILDKSSGCPLFILDNIRGFVCGQQDVYQQFSDKLFSNCKCKIIASRDVEFNRLSNRICEMPFGKTGKYENFEYKNGDYMDEISITSLNMNRDKEVEDFIENAVHFFVQEDKCILNTGKLACFFNKKKLKVAELRKFLADLSIFTLDAYQFKQLLLIISSQNFQRDDEITLPIVYAKYYDKLSIESDDTQKSAFAFDYTDENINFGDDWYKIREHKSVLDYTISQYYSRLLSEELAKSRDKRVYNLPNVLFPKSVTRFIVPKFAKNSKIVEYVSECFDYYKENLLSRIGMLAQLAFLLGRMEANKDKTIKLLKTLVETTLKISVDENDEVNGKAFLLRSLYVSLIYQGDTDALIEYCTKLVSKDKLYRNINIGFHLDYYGDKAYAFVINQTPIYDKISVSKCLNALRKLSSDLNSRMAEIIKNNSEKCSRYILQLITYCQILEERKYNLNNIATKTENFINNIIYFLIMVLYEYRDAYIKYFSKDIESYFKSILYNTIKKNYIKSKTMLTSKVKLYNKYSELQTIGRSGWLTRGLGGYDDKGIKLPTIGESVAEHTYNCMLLAYLFLPESSENLKENENTYDISKYNKKEIIQLLLIHDCCEVDIGDMVAKTDEDKNREASAMKKFIGADTDPLFKAWAGAWGTGDRSLTSDISYDIDRIQAVYQYLYYYIDKRYQIKEDVDQWLKELMKIRTNTGKEIMKHLIFENQIFIRNTDLYAKIFIFAYKYQY